MPVADLIKKLNQIKLDLEAAQKAQRDEIKGSSEVVKALQAEVKSLSGEVSKLSKASAKSNRILSDNSEPVIDTAQQVVDSEHWKSYRASGSQDSPKITVKGFRRKAAPLSNTLAGGDLSVDRRAGIIAAPPRSLAMRDLLNVQQTTENSIEYVRETGFYNLATSVATTANVSATSIVLNRVAGIAVGHVLTFNPGKVNEEEVEVLTVTESTKTITCAATAYQHLKGSEVVGELFTFTPETEVKPRASIDFELVPCRTHTLAHLVAASKQVLDDVDALRDTIDRRLVEGIDYNEEYQILYGAGGNKQLTGFFSDPAVPSYAWSAGPATDTKLDALRRAITFAQLANYDVDAVVLNPIDWQDIELAKGADGHYLQGLTVTDGRQARIWGVPVKVSNSLKQGDAIVGAFGLGATVYDRAGVDISASESHEDFFERNLVAIRAEARLAFCIERPQAFVKVDLSSGPTPAPVS